MSRKISKLLLLLVIFDFGLLFVWFRSGLIVAGGDTGLPIYNPSTIASIVQWAWWSGQGTGFSYPGILSSLPTYTLLSLIQQIVHTPLLMQVVFFGGVLILSTCGMFLLAKRISGNVSIAFFISLFYVINPYSMINVWHRGSYNGMVMSIVLPWTMYVLYRGLVEREIKFGIILALISPFFGFVFNTPAFIATWWFMIFSLWVYLLFTSTKTKSDKKYFILYLLGFIFLWLGLNAWWLIPFFHIAPTNLFITTTSGGNVSSLKGVSEYFTLPYALRGISTFYPIVQQEWGSTYLNPFFGLLSFIELAFITCALFFRKKIKLFSLFLFLFLAAVFISKGSGLPFGSVIVYAFGAIPYLGVFRNPFEKFGILIPFAQAFLAGYGLYYITTVIKSTNKRVVYGLVGISLLGFFIYLWPFFTGNVFGNVSYPAQVEVPREYDEVREWFTKQSSTDPRILHLPLALGDGMIYNWPHGYWGLESSQLFFPGSSISHYIGFPLVDARYKELAVAVRSRDDALFSSLLRKFAINYLVVHKDVDFSKYRSDTLANIMSFAESSPVLEKKAILGHLIIYKVKDTSQNRVYASQVDNPIRLSGNLGYYPIIVDNNNQTTVYSNTTDNDVGSAASDNQILPTSKFSTFTASINKDLLMQELPAVRFFPGSPFYPLIRLKEKLQLLDKDELGTLLLESQYSSKRLVEADRLLQTSKNKETTMALDEYIKELQRMKPLYKEKMQSYIQNYSTAELLVFEQNFFRQEELLRRMKESSAHDVKPKISNAETVLSDLLYETGIRARSGTNSSLDIPLYRFVVPRDDDYTINLGREWLSFFKDTSAVDIIIDGEKEKTEIQEYPNLLSLGPYHLRKGEHEIGFLIDTDNAIASISSSLKEKNMPVIYSDDNESGTMTLTTDKTPIYQEYSIENFNPYLNYLATFTYWSKLGLSPEISFIQDIDPVTKEEINLSESSPEMYLLYWKPASTSHFADYFARDMKLRITLRPWNNCVTMNKKNKAVCKDASMYDQFSRPSESLIKDVKLSKLPSNNIFLSSRGDGKELTQLLASQKINPTKYTVELRRIGNSVLVFHETYHDGWKLKDEKGNEIVAKHFLVDGYANGWDLHGLRPGKYSVEFVSQADHKYGILVGVIFTLLGVICMYKVSLWSRKRKHSS